ncbi:MAG TPA: PxKF domain-containing protein, partial [Gaiellaceae bacterium]|nr:PxKF domain-containing protein [Gaiellaceae bacterium]
ITCPSWPPHSIPAAGAGTPTGLSFGAASGHYSYGWQTSNTWAGTCRRFQLQLNDGTATLHTADFMFFS